MNLGRKRTKHIDKEKKKKIIYLTPCCLHAFPLRRDSRCSASDLVCYEQLCDTRAPIYHVFLITCPSSPENAHEAFR